MEGSADLKNSKQTAHVECYWVSFPWYHLYSNPPGLYKCELYKTLCNFFQYRISKLEEHFDSVVTKYWHKFASSFNDFKMIKIKQNRAKNIPEG